MGKKEKIILEELNLWHNNGLVEDELYEKLSSMYVIKSWNFVAIMKWVLIFGSILLGIGLISFITLIFHSRVFVVLVLTVLTLLGYYLGFFLSNRKNKNYYPKTGNAILVIASLTLCGDLFTIGDGFSIGDNHWTILLLITCIIYFLIAYLKKNELLLIMALLALATWFGMESGYVSGWGAYFLGLNYPLRFAIVSPFVILIGVLHKNVKFLELSSFVRIYYSIGLLYLNLSLWMLSIFGNYGNMYFWHKATHTELLLLVFVWLLVDGVIFFIGTRFDDRMFVGYAVVFSAINLYTRYFEYFWNEMHKSLFFILLGIFTLGAGFYVEKKLRSGSHFQ